MLSLYHLATKDLHLATKDLHLATKDLHLATKDLGIIGMTASQGKGKRDKPGE